jgi:hypothetical protein
MRGAALFMHFSSLYREKDGSSVSTFLELLRNFSKVSYWNDRAEVQISRPVPREAIRTGYR